MSVRPDVLAKAWASLTGWGGDAETERRFLRTLIHTIPDLVWLKDTQGVYLACNPRFEAFCGLREADLVGRTDYDFVDRDVADVFRAHDLAALAAGQACTNEEWLSFASDGYRGLFETTKTPMLDDQGRAIGVLGIAHDITQARQVQATLRQAQRVAQVGSWSIGVEQGHLQWSEETYRLFGIPAGQAVSFRDFMSRVHPDDRPAVTAAWTAALAGEPYDIEHRIVVDDRVLWVRERAEVQRHQGQAVTGIGTVQDITDRRADRQRLAESEERYRILAEYSTDWEYWLGPDGGYLYVSPGCEAISGHPPAAFVADPELMAAMLHPDDRAAWHGHWSAVTSPAADQLPHDAMELRVIDLQGRTRWIEHRCRPVFDRSGVYRGRRGVNRDITERIRVQQDLEQHRDHLEALVAERTSELVAARLRAEAASRAKSTFLANMSHEIRTPMNAIIGLTHLVRRSVSAPQQQDQLDKIADAAQHLLGLINDILDLSKIEAGKMVLSEDDFRIERVVDGVLHLLRDKATAKGLVLLTEVDASLQRVWHADSLRLGQILLNFASNAVKFTEHGQVRLAVTPASPSAQDTAGEPQRCWVRFEVQDTGIGIEPEQQQRLFADFEQADNSTSRRFGGTGLGLAISRRLVTLMSGGQRPRIGLESWPGLGSRFWFEVPLAPGRTDLATGAPPAREAAFLHGSGRRVLLVEDNPVNQEVALAMLLELGLQVDVAENGVQALQRVQACRYDLVLMDVQMPVMDGLEASRAIRALPQGRDLPILAMTANAFADDRQACLDAGMNDHLAKPVLPQTLLEVLSRWLPASAPIAQPVPADAAPLPPGDGADWVRALTVVPGLDSAVGLRSVNGSWAIYLRALRLFVDTHPADRPWLLERRNADDLAETQRRAHSIKGAAAVLGATAVSARATELEQALRRGEPDERVWAAAASLQVEHARLVQALSRVLDLMALKTPGDPPP